MSARKIRRGGVVVVVVDPSDFCVSTLESIPSGRRIKKAGRDLLGLLLLEEDLGGGRGRGGGRRIGATIGEVGEERGAEDGGKQSEESDDGFVVRVGGGDGGIDAEVGLG